MPASGVGRVALTAGDARGVIELYESAVGLAVRDSGTDRAVLGSGEMVLLGLHEGRRARASAVETADDGVRVTDPDGVERRLRS